MGFGSFIKKASGGLLGGSSGGGGATSNTKQAASNTATLNNRVDFTIDYEELAKAELLKLKQDQIEFESQFDGELTDQQKLEVIKLKLQKEALNVSKQSETRQKQNNLIIIVLAIIGGVWGLYKFFKERKKTK